MMPTTEERSEKRNWIEDYPRRSKRGKLLPPSDDETESPTEKDRLDWNKDEEAIAVGLNLQDKQFILKRKGSSYESSVPLNEIRQDLRETFAESTFCKGFYGSDKNLIYLIDKIIKPRIIDRKVAFLVSWYKYGFSYRTNVYWEDLLRNVRENVEKHSNSTSQSEFPFEFTWDFPASSSSSLRKNQLSIQDFTHTKSSLAILLAPFSLTVGEMERLSQEIKDGTPEARTKFHNLITSTSSTPSFSLSPPFPSSSFDNICVGSTISSPAYIKSQRRRINLSEPSSGLIGRERKEPASTSSVLKKSLSNLKKSERRTKKPIRSSTGLSVETSAGLSVESTENEEMGLKMVERKRKRSSRSYSCSIEREWIEPASTLSVMKKSKGEKTSPSESSPRSTEKGEMKPVSSSSVSKGFGREKKISLSSLSGKERDDLFGVSSGRGCVGTEGLDEKLTSFSSSSSKEQQSLRKRGKNKELEVIVLSSSSDSETPTSKKKVNSQNKQRVDNSQIGNRMKTRKKTQEEYEKLGKIFNIDRFLSEEEKENESTDNCQKRLTFDPVSSCSPSSLLSKVERNKEPYNQTQGRISVAIHSENENELPNEIFWLERMMNDITHEKKPLWSEHQPPLAPLCQNEKNGRTMELGSTLGSNIESSRSPSGSVRSFGSSSSSGSTESNGYTSMPGLIPASDFESFGSLGDSSSSSEPSEDLSEYQLDTDKEDFMNADRFQNKSAKIQRRREKLVQSRKNVTQKLIKLKEEEKQKEFSKNKKELYMELDGLKNKIQSSQTQLEQLRIQFEEMEEKMKFLLLDEKELNRSIENLEENQSILLQKKIALLKEREKINKVIQKLGDIKV